MLSVTCAKYIAIAGLAIFAGLGLGRAVNFLKKPNYKAWVENSVFVQEGRVFQRADECEIAIESKDRITRISSTSFGPRRFEYYNHSFFPTPLFGESCEFGVQLHLKRKD